MELFTDSYIGIVIPFAGTFEPEKWMFCKGQVLPIEKHEVLFSIISTTFGGNGLTTFALPNLCGRVAVHAGQGFQMQQYTLGQSGGNETVMLSVNNLPSHSHQVVGNITGKPPCSNDKGTTSIPGSNYPAIINGGAAQYSTSPDDDIVMGAVTISSSTPLPPAEVKEPINILSPFFTMNYIICVDGLYPPHG